MAFIANGHLHKMPSHPRLLTLALIGINFKDEYEGAWTSIWMVFAPKCDDPISPLDYSLQFGNKSCKSPFVKGFH